MAQALFYSSTAVQMTLTAPIASGDTTLALNTTSGLPASYPFKLLLDWGQASQEVVHCTNIAGLNATVVRGQDGTTAQSHSINAVVVHGVSAREFNDLESHVGASSGVHGLTGSVVGTSDTQTLTNKTLTSPVISTITNGGTLTLPSGTDTLVGRATTDTLTNKTLATPTVTGTLTGPSWSVNSSGVLATSNFSGSIQTYTPTFAGVTVGNGTVSGYYVKIATNLYWFQTQLSCGSTTTGSWTSVSLPTNINPSTGVAQWIRWSGNNNNVGGIAYGFGSSNVVAPMYVTSTANNANISLGVSNGDNVVVTGTFYGV